MLSRGCGYFGESESIICALEYRLRGCLSKEGGLGDFWEVVEKVGFLILGKSYGVLCGKWRILTF